MYAHNEKIKVKVSDEVKKGDLISTMGDSGEATGVHLHYTIFLEGEAIDPFVYTDLPYSKEMVLEYVQRGDVD